MIIIDFVTKKAAIAAFFIILLPERSFNTTAPNAAPFLQSAIPETGKERLRQFASGGLVFLPGAHRAYLYSCTLPKNRLY